MEKKRKTVGAISQELLHKEKDPISAIDVQQEAQKEYMDTLIGTILADRDRYPGDFYVVVETKREKLMPNVLRNYFFSRHTCPTPTYDQSVFRYNKASESIEYVWTVPDKLVVEYIEKHAHEMPASERPLIEYVFSFLDGSFDILCKKLNNESDNKLNDGVLIVES